jgi:hypothetical protein
MRRETVDEYIARGGIVTRCPAAWELTSAEHDARRPTSSRWTWRNATRDEKERLERRLREAMAVAG